MIKETLKTRLFDTELESALFIPSGICNMGEMPDGFEWESVGFLILKTITIEPRQGNDGIRIYEAYSGIFNSVGLANPGIHAFLETIKSQPPVKPYIISVAAFHIDEIEVFAGMLNELSPLAIELNLSCPNISHNKACLISQDLDEVIAFTRRAKKAFKRPVVVKLSPDVADITTFAVSAQDAGADGLALCNTYQGMAIDIASKAPVFERKVAGVSGPAIKPMTLYKVYCAFEKVKIPILATGGVCNAADALEFAMAGAACVGIGSATLKDPFAASKIKKGIEEYLLANGLKWQDIIGTAHR